MTVSFENQTLVVKTGITEELLKKAYGKGLVVYDKDGNQVYALNPTEIASQAAITPFCIVTNTVVDGELAMIKVLDGSYNINDVKAMYGDALVAAQKYLPQLIAQINERAEAIDDIFA